MDLKDRVRIGDTCTSCEAGELRLVRANPVIDRAGHSLMSFKCSSCEELVVQEQDNRFI